MTDARIALVGAAGAGKSSVLAAVAAAGGGAPTKNGDVAEVETATAVRRYRLLDAPAAAVPAVLGAHVDGAVLVVSAADGLLPASRAHLEAARSLSVPVLAAYLVVPEGLDVELVELVELEVAELLLAVHAGPAVPLIRSSGPAPRTHGGGHGHGAEARLGPALGLGALAAALDAWPGPSR